MALTASKVSSNSPMLPTPSSSRARGGGLSCSVPNSPQHCLQPTKIQGLSFSSRDGFWSVCRRPIGYIIHRGSSLLFRSMRSPRTGSTGDVRRSGDSSSASSGILSLDARARQDMAILGSEFLKLDARAREDTVRMIDLSVKKRAERLQHIANILKERAGSRLKDAAERHWSDGALEADLRRADNRAKQRAMEDTLMALEFVKNIHDRMVSKMYNFPLRRKDGSASSNVVLEKNGISLSQFPGEVSSDRIQALEEAYWSMAYALSEADGIDYTDPDELELLVATLIDLDAMDGKSSVSLLAECSSSPDVNTRRALANALAAAPSMWTLGNAGMGALQRLAEDSNPAIAAAASKAITELKKQWEIEEGDNWRFTVDPKTLKYTDTLEDNDQEA